MQVRQLVDDLDGRYPFCRAAQWDPVGLQVGDQFDDVGRVAVCHEVSRSVVDHAIESGIDTIVSYHPLLFAPVTSLVGGASAEGRALSLANGNVNLIVVHTALDAAEPGTGDFLLECLGYEVLSPFAEVEGRPASFIGRLGRTKERVSGADVVALVEASLSTRVRSTVAPRRVRTVAVVPGSGGFAIEEASELADVIVTGDVSHHQATAAVERGLMVIDAGHIATERPAITSLYSEVRNLVGTADLIADDPTPWED